MTKGGKNVSQKKRNPDFQTPEFALGYLYRSIETQLNDFGAETGGAISVADAARWVAKLLLAKAGGLVLDRAQHLPTLRGAAAEGDEVSATKAPVHVRSRDLGTLKPKRVLSAKARKLISKAQKARWKRYHQEMEKKHAA